MRSITLCTLGLAAVAAAVGLWIGYASGSRGTRSEDDLAEAGFQTSIEAAKDDPGFAKSESIAAKLASLTAGGIRHLLRRGGRDYATQRLLVWRLSQIDPEQAYAFVLKHRHEGEREELLQLVIFEWAKSDPDAALQSSRWLDDPDLRGRTFDTAFRSILANEPIGDALARFRRLQIPMESLRDQLARWLQKHPEVPVSAIADLPRSNVFIEGLSLGKARDDPQAAIQWLESSGLKGRNLGSAHLGVLNALAESDPAAAMRYFEKLSRHGFNQSDPWIGELLKSHQKETLEWIAGLPEFTRDRILFSHFGELDPATAREYAHLLPADRRSEMAVDSLVRSMRRDLAAMRKWVDALPDGYLRARAFDGLSGILPIDQLPDAYAEIATAPAGRFPPSYAAGLARLRAFEDPDGAIAWLKEVPDHLREIASRSFIDQVGQRYPDKAIELIGRLPEDGYARAAATSALATRLLHPQSMAKGHNILSRLLASLEGAAEKQAAANAIHNAERLAPETATELLATLDAN